LMAEYLATGTRRLPAFGDIGASALAPLPVSSGAGNFRTASLRPQLYPLAKENDVIAMPTAPVSGLGASADAVTVVSSPSQLEQPAPVPADKKSSGSVPLLSPLQGKTYSKRVLDAVFAKSLTEWNDSQDLK